MTDANAKALEDRGWELLNNRKWQEAAAEFNELLALDRDNEAGLQGRIACHRLLNEYEQANDLLVEGLKKHPKSVGILCERAWLDYGQKKYAEAIKDFEAVLRIHKKDPELFSWNISLLRAEHRFEEAERQLNEALKLFRNNYSLMIELGWLRFYTNRFEEAAVVFEDILRVHTDNEMALQGKIACLRMRGEFAAAKRQAERATERLGKRHAGILSEIAWLNYEQDNYEEAQKVFEDVVDLDPSDPYAHINLAVSMVRQELLAKASEECRLAISMDPMLPEARGCMGIIAFKQGRLVEAEAQLALSIAGGSRGGDYADLGALYIHMGRYDEAEVVLKKGLAVKREDGSIHLELGNLYLQTEKPISAIAEFRQAISIDPKNPDPVRALAIALMESGKLAEAESTLRMAIRAFDEPKRWRLHLTLCQVLTRLADDTGDLDLCGEALSEATAALRIAADSPEPYFFSGIVRFKLDDYYGALDCFRHCQRIDKDHIDAEINARRVKALLRRERIRSRTSLWTGVILASIILAQLGLLWWCRIKYGAGKDAVVTPTMFTVLVPICLGLIVVSILLPYLSRLKLTGLEAELSQPTAAQSLASGLKGEIDFGSGFLNVSGALTGHRVPRPETVGN
jgi:tetratricopeptide (TPR) repeat protein